ncbi:MAG: 5-deoxy-glucuronate isomerase [Spirochaetales bacterium]|nr:5-deoxy-glucuronate isomerase [Spirochaetales bacterium]
MKSSIEKYGAKIEAGSINPVVNVEKHPGGIVFDPADDATPLDVAGFGIFKLNGSSGKTETQGREYVLVPTDGRFTVKTENQTYLLERIGGAFAAAIGASNASAVYIPRDSSFEVSGTGEIIYFSAPSSKKMKPMQIAQKEKPNLSRGNLFWRRDVITLVEPGVSTNLIVGETWSPPALWSGTPLHIHDDDTVQNESAHEEVYYHITPMSGREVPNYTVQLMFDGKSMNKAFLCPNKTAVAIPGGSHPVVASPVSDSLYVWGLAGKEGPLGMRDLKDFAYMKLLGPFEQKLRKSHDSKFTITVPRAKLDAFIKENNLDTLQARVSELTLREWGIAFTQT